MGHSEDSPEREVHRNTGLSKKDRKISNKQPNLTSTTTGRTTTNKAQSEQKEGNNQDHNRINDIETKGTIQMINKSRSLFFEKINKIDKTHQEKKREDTINKIRN